MMKQTALIGLMLVVGALLLTMVSAQDLNGCFFTDDIHYYHSPGDFTLWESKKDDLLIRGGPFVLAGRVVDLCMGGGPPTDNDDETGLGSARLQVVAVPACGPWIPDHNLAFYVHDFLGNIDPIFRDVVSGWAGADGPAPGMPCGNGIISTLDPTDCLAHWWGKGPHVACGVGADGSYWVFLDAVGIDPNEPRVGASTDGCIWTTNFGGKGVKALC